jgi:hypothetical protein
MQTGAPDKLRFTIVAAASSLLLTGCISVVERQAPVPRDGVIAVITPGHPEKLIFGNHADAKTFVPFYGFAK